MGGADRELGSRQRGEIGFVNGFYIARWAQEGFNFELDEVYLHVQTFVLLEITGPLYPPSPKQTLGVLGAG